jgi:hypothetical protein
MLCPFPYRGIERPIEGNLELIEIARDVVTGDTGCQFADVIDAPLRQTWPIDEAHANAEGSRLNVVLGEALHSAQLAQ